MALFSAVIPRQAEGLSPEPRTTECPREASRKPVPSQAAALVLGSRLDPSDRPGMTARSQPQVGVKGRWYLQTQSATKNSAETKKPGGRPPGFS
jgi:hypothetical protein